MISPEEYLMKNFYAYKEKREKFIQNSLKRIATFEQKKQITPAKLLSETNIFSQLSSLLVTQESDDSSTAEKDNSIKSNRRLYQSGHSDGLNESKDDIMKRDSSEIDDLFYDKSRRVSAGAKLVSDFNPSKKSKYSNSEGDDSSISQIESLDDLFGINSMKQRYRIMVNSLYSGYSTFTVKNYIVKVGDDVRQEYFAMQIINEFQTIFKLKKLKLILTPYEIVPMGPKA